MFTRDDFFKMLNDSPLYKMAKSSLKSDAEKRQLDAFIAERFGTIVEVLANASARAENDPEFREELNRVVTGGEPVVIDGTETVVTSSIG